MDFPSNYNDYFEMNKVIYMFYKNIMIFKEEMRKMSTLNSMQRPYLNSTNCNNLTTTQESNRIVHTQPNASENPINFKDYLKKPVITAKKLDWFSFIKKPNKNVIKKTFMNVWIGDNFPLHFKQLLPILNYLSSGNMMLSKLNQILNTEVTYMNNNGYI